MSSETLMNIEVGRLATIGSRVPPSCTMLLITLFQYLFLLIAKVLCGASHCHPARDDVRDEALILPDDERIDSWVCERGSAAINQPVGQCRPCD